MAQPAPDQRLADSPNQRLRNTSAGMRSWTASADSPDRIERENENAPDNLTRESFEIKRKIPQQRSDPDILMPRKPGKNILLIPKIEHHLLTRRFAHKKTPAVQ